MPKTISRAICDGIPRRTAYIALATALVWTTPTLAAPQGPNSGETTRPTMDPAAAEAKFNTGLRLFKAGKMADALPVFREAADGSGSPNARLYVGHCLQQLGKYVEAHRAFTAVVKQTTRRGDTKYETTREAALAQLGLLEPRIAKIVVSLVDIPKGLAVTLDGAALEEKDLGTPIVVEPGMHKVEGTAPEMASVYRDITVDVGESKTTILTFKKLEPGPALGSEPASKIDASPSKPFPLRTVGFVAGGVGVAGMAVFTVAGLMAKSTFKRMSDVCGSAGCSDPGQLSEIDKGRSQQTLANVGLAVGLVGLSAGAALVILGGRHQDNDASPTVAITGAPGGGAAISYSGKF
jgi:hypothetical protein